MKFRVLAVVFFAAMAAHAQSDRKFLKSETAAARHLPFSAGVLVDHTLYVAGTAAEPAQITAGMSAEQEARTVMDAIKKTVQSAGMTMSDVVSVQVFCSDLALYDTFNRVYNTYFHNNYPARAFIGAKLLFGARFEVSAVAVGKH